MCIFDSSAAEKPFEVNYLYLEPMKIFPGMWKHTGAGTDWTRLSGDGVSLLSLGREVGRALDSMMTMIQGAGPGFCLGTGLGQTRQTSMRASLEVAVN